MEPAGTPEVEQNPPVIGSDPATPPPASAPARAPRKRDSTWETVRSLIIVVVAVLIIRTFVGEATVIPTGSMENTILIGDHVFLDKLPYGPRIPFTSLRLPSIEKIHRGDVVAFHYPLDPSLMYVKRVVGVGGDVIRVVNKQVYRNGKLLIEPYVIHTRPGIVGWADNFPPPPADVPELAAEWGVDPGWAHNILKYIHKDGLHVPKGYLFVMGDNRDDSSDSRFWGFVPIQNVVGEPLFVYWSYKAPTVDWMQTSLEGRLRFDGSIVANFFQRTRWSRIGRLFPNPHVQSAP